MHYSLNAYYEFLPVWREERSRGSRQQSVACGIDRSRWEPETYRDGGLACGMHQSSVVRRPTVCSMRLYATTYIAVFMTLLRSAPWKMDRPVQMQLRRHAKIHNFYMSATILGHYVDGDTNTLRTYVCTAKRPSCSWNSNRTVCRSLSLKTGEFLNQSLHDHTRACKRIGYGHI
jgi:hypothetical protein